MKRVAIGLLAVMALFAVILSGGAQPHGAQASTPGATVKPLLTCPTVSGGGQVDLFNDIFGVAFAFGDDSDDTGPGEPDGYHPLYDVALADGTIDLFNDIFGVAMRFGEVCPAVDTQVAKATLWGIANLPKLDDAAGRAALQALGYYEGSSDVPGQGIHYVKLQNWDGTFNPEAPEGVVYYDGKLAAQLYVTSGEVVGWGAYPPPSYPPPPRPNDIDLEGSVSGPQCSPACSWAGTLDGWHLHYYLCTAHVGAAHGTPIAVPGMTFANCDSFTGSEPVCTAPITTTPCYRWAQNVGWMGHLWAHQLNPNQVGDIGPGGTNGRFADCVPDTEGWKAFNCPG